MDKFLKRSASVSGGTEETKKLKSRKYIESYLKYGFTELGNKPQCVVCCEVLSVECMKPSKMIRHLEGKHPGLKDKPVSFFEQKLAILKNQKGSIINMGNTNQNALLASYDVALQIAQKAKPHTIAEELLLPAAIDMVSRVISPQEALKLKNIPLSNDSIARRISDMTENVKDQLKEKLKQSEFISIQIDESTDVAGCSQFLCFVRYETGESIEENILFCKPLPDYTTGECMFDLFVKATEPFEIDWKKCVSICSDGAAALTGKYSGLITRLKTIMPNANWVHCFLHRQALATKKMPPELRQVLDDAVKVVNFVKTRPLQKRLFSILCDEMGALHKNLLFHTEVRWLSRGNVLCRLFELRAEMLIFLQDANPELAKFFADEEWLIQLAYLADLFSQINILNMSLQGPDKTILFAQDKVNAFAKKLTLWEKRVKKMNFENFALTNEFKEFVSSVGDDSLDLTFFSLLVSTHLKALKIQLLDYIPTEDTSGVQWVLYPFKDNIVEKAEMDPNLHDKLIELSSDQSKKLLYESEFVDRFWLGVRNEYPELVSKAMKLLIPFATSYLCESGFSRMVSIKTKSRNRLSLENDMILCITNIKPDVLKIAKSKQAQGSH